MSRQYQAHTFVNSDYIQQGQTVRFEVRGEFYIVMSVTDTEIILFCKSGIVTHKPNTGIYYTISNDQVRPEIMVNLNSNVSHMTLNGKSLCGSTGDFTQQMISSDKVTCKHCMEVI